MIFQMNEKCGNNKQSDKPLKTNDVIALMNSQTKPSTYTENWQILLVADFKFPMVKHLCTLILIFQWKSWEISERHVEISKDPFHACEHRFQCLTTPICDSLGKNWHHSVGWDQLHSQFWYVLLQPTRFSCGKWQAKNPLKIPPNRNNGNRMKCKVWKWTKIRCMYARVFGSRSSVFGFGFGSHRMMMLDGCKPFFDVKFLVKKAWINRTLAMNMCRQKPTMQKLLQNPTRWSEIIQVSIQGTSKWLQKKNPKRILKYDQSNSTARLNVFKIQKEIKLLPLTA